MHCCSIECWLHSTGAGHYEHTVKLAVCISITFPVGIQSSLCGGAGAGQGIGRAFAHALGEAGASVAIVDINFKKAQVVTEELRSKGIRSIAVGTDVTKKADCKK